MLLRILHTNDLHSRFENFARVVTKIKEIRTENTLVLDAGDFNDFSRIELQGTAGKAGCSLLKLGGYDAIAVGNNEGFSGKETIEAMTSTGLITFLSSNLYKNNIESIEGLKRSIIIERAGLKILIIGTTPQFNEFFILDNMYATDPLEEINREIEENNGKYDMCILLSHQGIKEDLIIAEKVKGADIIIGGHSHTLMEDASIVNGVIIHQSGSYGEYLGVIDVEIEDNLLKSYKAQNIKLDGVFQDEEILDELLKQKEIAITNLSIPLYKVDRDIWHDVIEENPITNLLADGLRAVMPCDIGIINSGVINGGIKKGNVSKKKLLEISPSPLNPTYMEIKGSDIKEALRQSLQADFCLQDGKGSGFRGRYLGRLHISGAVIEHDGKNILRVMLDNGEMEDERVYRVATSDYLQRGTGYTSLANNTNVKYNAEYMRDTLEEYLKHVDYVDKCFKDRWIKI
ncbi:MAG: yfkN 2 [Clostridiales bacterium]|jgi:2',3'-cyclic-nucleotide 2'-phosphodiesterase (5'-nucleotidase family)|nr:yfkN 2 [Clostridiales bacterium]